MTWLLTWAAPAVIQLVLSLAFSNVGISGSAVGLFWLVIVAASTCMVSSAAVVVRAVLRREAELGYIGLFFLAVSVLPLVNGLTTPGVLYGSNSAVTSSMQWSVPTALLLASPLLLPPGLRRSHAHRIWTRWAAVGIVSLFTVAAALLIRTELLPAFQSRSVAAYALGIASFVGCVILGRRHLYLARVANSRLPLIVSAGFGSVGASVFIWIGSEPFSIGFWVAHMLDVSGVLGGSLGALVVLRSTTRVRAVIEPILATDPLAALELGIDPIVHRFVAELEAKDPITRDHVIRTAELAVEIGTELELTAGELRQLGLTALLHDVGKLKIPDEILNKPGALSDHEYGVMKRHARFGQSIVETSPALADIGLLIRSHHERIDGNGYPDGLTGQAIPLIARIVAVCDSYDAMANTRRYRDGMGSERALAILQEHAGSQWDVAVVRAAVEVVRRNPERRTAATLQSVGRAANPSSPDRIGCDCLPAELVAAGE